MVLILWATVSLFIETSKLTITRAVLEQPMTLASYAMHTHDFLLRQASIGAE